MVFFISQFDMKMIYILFRIVAAGEALYTGVKFIRSGRSEDFLIPKKAVLEIGVASLLIFFLTFVPNWLIVKPVMNFFAQPIPGKSEEEISAVEEKMLHHLEARYKKKFTVIETSYTSKLGKYEFVLSPIDQSLHFNGVYYPSSKTIEDYYVNGIWEKEFNQIAEPLVTSLFENVWEYSNGILVDEEIRKELIDPINIPSYKRLRELYREGYGQRLQLDVFEKMNETNKMDKLEKVYELVNLVKSHEINNMELVISFYDEGLQETKPPKLFPYFYHNDYLQYKTSIPKSKFSQINSVEDLLAFTEKNEDYVGSR